MSDDEHNHIHLDEEEIEEETDKILMKKLSWMYTPKHGHTNFQKILHYFGFGGHHDNCHHNDHHEKNNKQNYLEKNPNYYTVG